MVVIRLENLHEVSNNELPRPPDTTGKSMLFGTTLKERFKIVGLMVRTPNMSPPPIEYVIITADPGYYSHYSWGKAVQLSSRDSYILECPSDIEFAPGTKLQVQIEVGEMDTSGMVVEVVGPGALGEFPQSTWISPFPLGIGLFVTGLIMTTWLLECIFSLI